MDRNQLEVNKLDVNPTIAGALRRAKLKSVRDILSVSAPLLHCLTGLSPTDVQQLLTTASTACRRRPPTPALVLKRDTCGGFESSHRLSLACPELDDLLRGGLPMGGIIELSGESGAGKTQLALQLCLSVQYPPEHGGLNAGAVYICTEDSFPIKRLHQLIGEQAHLRSDVPPEVIRAIGFSDHIYVEHAADLAALQVCLARRVPLLLARGVVRLVVVDSLAALFRAEFQADDWQERTRQLLAFAAVLHRLSHEYTTPVICINQVMDVIDGSDSLQESLGPRNSKVSPALGLAWASQVMMRLMLSRVQGTVSQSDQSSALRRLEVVFAPHLARSSRDVAVWREGVRGVSHLQTHTQ